MKLVTFYTQDYEELATITVPRFKLFCKNNNIEFKLYKLPQNGTRVDFCWKKIEICKKELSCDTDGIIWSDVDVLILNTNYNMVELFNFKSKPMLISSDDNGICMGFFVLKNCEWGKKYLDTMLFCGNINLELEKKLITVNAGDQSCAKYLLGFNNIYENIYILPNDGLISNPIVGIKSTTFAVHYWANGGKEERKIILNKMDGDIKRYQNNEYIK
jgi:hypothetical protein